MDSECLFPGKHQFARATSALLRTARLCQYTALGFPRCLGARSSRGAACQVVGAVAVAIAQVRGRCRGSAYGHLSDRYCRAGAPTRRNSAHLVGSGLRHAGLLRELPAQIAKGIAVPWNAAPARLQGATCAADGQCPGRYRVSLRGSVAIDGHAHAGELSGLFSLHCSNTRAGMSPAVGMNSQGLAIRCCQTLVQSQGYLSAQGLGRDLVCWSVESEAIADAR